MAVIIICSILAFISIISALLLSKAGSSSGLATLAGQDLEIFKQTKDRGWIKGLQIFLFMISIILVLIALIVAYI